MLVGRTFLCFVVCVALLNGGCASTDREGGVAWSGWDEPAPKARNKSRPKRVAAISPATPAAPSSEIDYGRILAVCLEAASPFLCQHDQIKDADRKRVNEAQYAANLKRCLADETRSLCQRDMLRPEDDQFLRAAEYRTNLAACMSGYATSRCDRSALTPADLQEVEKVEYANNVKLCLSGYSPLCRKELLSADDARRIEQVQQTTKGAETYVPAGRTAPVACSSGDPCASRGNARAISVHNADPVPSRP